MTIGLNQSRESSSKTFCQQPLPFIFPINRLAITMTYILEQDSLPKSGLNQKDLIEAMSMFAYRVPYSVVAAPDINRRKEGCSFNCPPLEVIENAVNGMFLLDDARIADAERSLKKYIPGFSREDCWQTVLKFVFLLEFCKAAKTDIPLFKKEFALPKGHYKSLQDFTLKEETIPAPVYTEIMDITQTEVKLSQATIQNLWMVAACKTYQVEIRPIVKTFFTALPNKATSKTWDHDIFELIFTDAITDGNGMPISLPKTTHDWTECITRLGNSLQLNPNLLFKKLKNKSTSYKLPEDDDSKAKNTSLGCQRGERRCQDPVLRFLTDILTIFKWVRLNYGFCQRDSAVYTLYLIPHLAFWQLTFNCAATKQNMDFPWFQKEEMDVRFFMRPRKICSFLIHVSRKFGAVNYLHWAFSGFAENFLDDSALQEQSLQKARGHLNENKEYLYSAYQGACGQNLVNVVLNNHYHCL